MLPFHENIVGDLVEEDGLVVIGAGLGLERVLASLIRVHSATDGVAFILSTSDSQRQTLREELQEQDIHADLPIDINNEYTASDRLNFYSQGGVFFITSRILIVDMLNERVPLSKVAGMIVLNAHRLSETCTEAFIVRLFRAKNKKGYIRAFSDRAHAMVSGFAKTERIMKCLFVRRLHLWPRFQLSVASALEQNPPEVIDIRIPLTTFMQGIQAAILEVMDACLKELRKTNKLDVEDLTVENGLFKSFDEIIRRQLDPIWHIIGRKTKQLVGDLKTLRKLADYLIRYDAVTFLKYLDTLRASEGVRSVWIFANPTHRIFEFAKRRVFQIVRTDTGKPGSLGALGRGLGQYKKRGRGGMRRLSGERGAEISDGNGKRSKVDKKVTVGGGFVKIPDDTGNAEKGSGLGKSGDDTNIMVETEAGSDGGRTIGDLPAVELEVTVEDMPKWKVLREVLEEIEEERQRIIAEASNGSSFKDTWGDGVGAVLVACKDERTCMQLQKCITIGSQKLMNEEWEKYLLGKAELHGMHTRKKKKNQGVKGVGFLDGKAHVVPDLGDANRSFKEEHEVLLAAAAEVVVRDKEVIAVGDGISSPRCAKGRGRGRKKGKSNTAGGHGAKKCIGEGKRKEKGENLNKEDSITGDMLALGVEQNLSKKPFKELESFHEEELIEEVINDSKVMAWEENKVEKRLPPIHFYALESEQRILEVLKPSFVVVYDPYMAFVREMEVYKAEHRTTPLKVYFLFYESSTEVQKFEASIHRENSAFESLIRQKASMMIPVDQDGRMLDSTSPANPTTALGLNALTRKAGGRKGPEKQMQVVVDMREFGSSLPCVLHQQGIRILPVTLEVGDYILSPDICVERKSLADLFSSFASGRLYHQAEIMTRYYRIPVLLIEFSQDKSFSLQSASEVGDDIIPANIVSKICLLVLHFPRLRLIWSRSLYATAEIFATLKANQDEPDVEKAVRVGVPTEDGLIEGDIRAESYNTTAVELLRRLPGVTDANYRSLIDGCTSLADIALLPLERLAELMGGHRPARMLHDFLDAKCPTLT